MAVSILQSAASDAGRFLMTVATGRGGARAGAGRRPSEKTIFLREFVGPMPAKKRRRYATDAEREDARKQAQRRSDAKRAPILAEKRAQAREADGREKHERTVRHVLECERCGSRFVAKLRSAKYCSAECRNKASNKAASLRALEKAREPIRCKRCGVEFCRIDLSSRNMQHCSEYCSKGYGREKHRRRTDLVFDMQRRVRALAHNALRNKGFKKKAKTAEVLGCDFEFFKRHIERQFERGMSWDNRGEWHLDHIIPLATAKSEEEVLMLGHFTNLRPLWAAENLAKRDKVLTLL